MSLGGRDNLLFRADVLWQPTDRFSLRFNATKDDRENAPARVIRISNPGGALHGCVQRARRQSGASRASASHQPRVPAPPFALEIDRYTAASHEAGFPGGQVGRWQTREDLRGVDWIDHQYGILTLDWQLTNRFSLRSLTSLQEQRQRPLRSERLVRARRLLGLVRDEPQWKTQELHDRQPFQWPARDVARFLYYQDLEVWSRYSSWPFWEFAIPNTGPNPGRRVHPASAVGRCGIRRPLATCSRGVPRWAIPRWRTSLRPPALPPIVCISPRKPTARSLANSRSGLPQARSDARFSVHG